MFTGIIEEIGTVDSVVSGASAGSIRISARTVLEGTKLGDSIAVNGVCLTVTGISSGSFTADVMPETLRRSNLGLLKKGDRVNLERAMSAGGRFGGHIVSGHIDGTGVISAMKREQNAVWVTVKTDPSILALIVEKGSIAIDGISLTVAGLDSSSFSVSVIPHTGGQTALLTKRAGDRVNLENDMIGKYVQRLMSPPSSAKEQESRIDESFLAKYGFM
ncbi:MAG: riboflavin synthase [Clostridia bacterium]|nr:riboflavin synthase [Clostridia bacterium]